MVTEFDTAHPLISIYRCMRLSREIDSVKADLVARGEAFFHISGEGHEGIAILNRHLQPNDWLQLHYRDKALLLARGVSAETFLHSALCNEHSPSQGRQMSGMLSSRELNVLSTTTVVGNGALHAVGVASVICKRPGDAIVVCTLGDGTTQQGEFFEAIAETIRSHLPVLFIVENNGWSISTRTRGKTFYSLPNWLPEAREFFGLPIHRLDGRDVAASDSTLGDIVYSVRHERRPAITVLDVERLADHSNADDERSYRTEASRQLARQIGDPITNLRCRLLEAGVAERTLSRIDELASEEVEKATQSALATNQPTPAYSASRSPMLQQSRQNLRPVSQRIDKTQFLHSSTLGTLLNEKVTMLEAMRAVLYWRMAAYPEIALFGQDIEDPKGDIFGLTRGLSHKFPGRVVNAPLSESTIVGMGIGQALAGIRPVVFIQFADFLPLAFNQIASELSTLYWRTAGEWECPLIIMAACGGYRPGLGPFHSQTYESILAHVPGLDVFVPSTAADAAGMLNSAFDSGRPTLFLYPKMCLNDRDLVADVAALGESIPIGEARRVEKGNDLTIVAWGNTVRLCERAVEVLRPVGHSIDLFDLRFICPWDRSAICSSVSRTRKLLVVHEDNLTCGFGGEVIASVSESVRGIVDTRRVTRPDTHVPFNFTNQLQILPSYRQVLSSAAELLDLELEWAAPMAASAGSLTIEATGTSPTDQSMSVVAWQVETGMAVRVNDVLAEMEADKAVYELNSPVDGIVEDILVKEGISVKLHTPLIRIRPSETKLWTKQQIHEERLEPYLRKKTKLAATPSHSSSQPIGISRVFAITGSARLTNEELAARFEGRTTEDILNRTGIKSRPVLAENESLLDLAVEAARKLLDAEQVNVNEISMIICSTTTPPYVTPSLACRILSELNDAGDHFIPCHDILAACTGYIYALSAGFDFLVTRPKAKVLVITAEALTKVTDSKDFDTAILFGDAASATLLYGADTNSASFGWLHQPLISAKGEDGSCLRVPMPGLGHITMNGKKVFSEAVRQMSAILSEVCKQSNLRVEDLNMVIPHQANGRIIDALRSRLNLPVGRLVTHISNTGNTSSSSIPVCLSRMDSQLRAGQQIGLCAFGGGYTFGAAVITLS